MCLTDAAGPRRTAQYVAISATLAGVRGVLCPLLSAVLIETVGVRSVYAVAAAVMLSAGILSAAIWSPTTTRPTIIVAPPTPLPVPAMRRSLALAPSEQAPASVTSPTAVPALST